MISCGTRGETGPQEHAEQATEETIGAKLNRLNAEMAEIEAERPRHGGIVMDELERTLNEMPFGADIELIPKPGQKLYLEWHKYNHIYRVSDCEYGSSYRGLRGGYDLPRTELLVESNEQAGDGLNSRALLPVAQAVRSCTIIMHEKEPTSK